MLVPRNRSISNSKLPASTGEEPSIGEDEEREEEAGAAAREATSSAAAPTATAAAEAAAEVEDGDEPRASEGRSESGEGLLPEAFAADVLLALPAAAAAADDDEPPPILSPESGGRGDPERAEGERPPPPPPLLPLPPSGVPPPPPPVDDDVLRRRTHRPASTTSAAAAAEHGESLATSTLRGWPPLGFLKERRCPTREREEKENATKSPGREAMASWSPPPPLLFLGVFPAAPPPPPPRPHLALRSARACAWQGSESSLQRPTNLSSRDSSR